MSKPKTLVLDIETSAIESYTWGLWEQNVGLDMIKSEWTIMAYAAKWLNKRGVIYQDTGGRGTDKVRDDKPLMKGLWDLLDEADLIIAQNGKRFDIKKINARLIMNGFSPYSPIRVIDTLSSAKKHFAFTSNKLAWMSQYLTASKKSAHKKFPGFELWAECLKDNPEAWAVMKKYNIRDVIATEQLYYKLLPWIDNHPNVGVYAPATDKHLCPNCGSSKTQKRGLAVTQQRQYTRYHCQSCGSWSKSKNCIKGGRTR